MQSQLTKISLFLNNTNKQLGKNKNITIPMSSKLETLSNKTEQKIGKDLLTKFPGKFDK